MSFAYTAPTDRLSKIYTPPTLAKWLYKLTKHVKPSWVLDPCVGSGNFIAPWLDKFDCYGVDVDNQLQFKQDMDSLFFVHGAFENTQRNQYPESMPLVVCNPPFNGHWRKRNYPEVFLRKIVDLFGVQTQIVFCCPMGIVSNQRRTSARYRWMRDEGPQITSRIGCPIDLYPDTLFHTEILLFNIKRVKPHYFLPDEVLDASCTD